MLQLDVNALLLAIIPLAAAGIGYLYDRSCKRRDARRAEMIELLTKQRDEAEAEAERARREAREEIERVKREAKEQIALAVSQERRQRNLALAYWQQLVKNGIDPIVAIGEGEAE